MFTDKDQYFIEAYNEACGYDPDNSLTIINYNYEDFSSLLYDNKIVIDVYDMECHLSTSESILLSFNDQDIGYIVSSNKEDTINDNLSLFTADEILFIWNFYRKNNILLNKLENNFLIVNYDYANTYFEKFYGKETLWGGFNHKKYIEMPSKKIEKIYLPDLEIKFPTELNLTNSVNSIKSNNIFDLFLKNYHNIELLFNLIFLRELRRIDINNISEANSIYKKLNKDEIESLRYLISEFTNNKVTQIKLIIKAFNEYSIITQEILYEYGKESSPVKDPVVRDKFNQFLEKCNLDTPQTISQFLEISKAKKLKNDEKSFKDFINNFIAYFIYRIRCSIAHKKFGEFIFSENEEHKNFMIDISIPLIKSTTIEIFSNQKFKNIFSD